MLKEFFGKLFDQKPKEKDFLITEVTQYSDTSYGLQIKSTMYTAVDKISGSVVCRYVYGATLNADQLKIALDRGQLPGKTYTQ